MEIFRAMRPDNGSEVSQLISGGSDVNAKGDFDLTLIQHAALEYSLQIARVGELTEEAQELRQRWAATIAPLVATDSLVTKKVTKAAWDSRSLAGIPKARDVAVDAMLHDVGYHKSEIAEDRGYRTWPSSGRVRGKGQSLFILFLNDSSFGAC